jgi:hypothetical protein
MGWADLEPDRSHHGGNLRTGSSSTWHRGKQERTPLAGFALSRSEGMRENLTHLNFRAGQVLAPYPKPYPDDILSIESLHPICSIFIGLYQVETETN